MCLVELPVSQKQGKQEEIHMTEKLIWCNMDNHRILVLRRRRKYDVVHVAETLVPAAFSQFSIDAQRHYTQ